MGGSVDLLPADQLIAQTRLSYPRWHPQGDRETFFLRDPEPLSDDTRLLKKTISVHVSPGDIILTTVLQAPFFQAIEGTTIHAYDISPLQIVACQERFTNINTYRLCDVYESDMIRETLSLTRPTVVFLSNIPEWGSDEDRRVLLDAIKAQPTVKKIIFTKIMLEASGSYRLAELLEQEGWQVESSASTSQYVYVATRISPK